MTKPFRVPDFYKSRQAGQKLSVLTAYDFTFAKIFDRAGVDCLLVGDSLASVLHGKETTLSVTLDEMIYHCKMVVAGVQRALVVADMPFMSYQLNSEDALRSAGRLVKEAGVGAVKLEGGGEQAAEAISKIVKAGIPVMGHVGLTPQSFHEFGGHKLQGRNEQSQAKILQEAQAVQDAGAFSIVLEGIPAVLGKKVTENLSIATIGIGAGPHCSGQVLVSYDLLGLTEEEGKSQPRFVRQYEKFAERAKSAAESFVSDVQAGEYPNDSESY